MKYFIKQIKNKDCGFTSLKILLANIYKRKDFLFYPQSIDDRSYSFLDLIGIAKKEGVNLKGFQASDKNELLNNKKYPLLLVLKKSNSLHMIVLLKRDRRGFRIADPSRGIYSIKSEELIEEWNGEFLEVEEVKGSNFYQKSKPVIPLFYRVIQVFFQSLSFIMLACGLYLINDKVRFFVPLILFLLSIIFEIVHKAICIKGMKYFDLSISSRIKDDEIYPPHFIRDISQYKCIFFGQNIQIISGIFMLSLLIVILGINSYLNLINLLILSIISAFIYFIIEKQIKKMHFNNKEIEEIWQKGKINKNFFKKVNDLSYQEATLINIKKYCLLFIDVIVCLFYASLTDNISLNFIVFHFFIYYIFVENIDSFISILNKKDDVAYFKCLYLNYMQ